MCHLYTLEIIKYTDTIHVVVEIIRGIQEEDYIEELEQAETGTKRKSVRSKKSEEKGTEEKGEEEKEDDDEKMSVASKRSSTSTISVATSKKKRNV